MVINTQTSSARLRERAIRLPEKQILIASLTGSKQEKDLTMPANCNGYGRIRHFRLLQYPDWSPNPLPILPAAKALGYTANQELQAQVFQNAACNWRCWYCYVDFNRLSADRRVSNYFTASELIEMYLAEQDRPEVIDLSGGQPDLTPEWILWTMEALEERGLANRVFLWSDDNLSNKYFWEYLTAKERKRIARFPKYARVACFKGYDEASFAFNTSAEPELFEQQFGIFRQLLAEGLDMYAYITFTAIPHHGIVHQMNRFIDKLQMIHPNLPLRTIPLKISVFKPTEGRVKATHKDALNFQYEVHAAWCEELISRYSPMEREIPICDILMSST